MNAAQIGPCYLDASAQDIMRSKMTSEDLFLSRVGCEQLWSVLSILSVVPFGQ